MLKVPNVRWPGGCFADQYHWRDGIGKPEERRSRINNHWGGTPEPNTFGTHEYFDFLDMIGSEAFISANVGSGTIQEAADWLEYLTATGTSLAEERTRNGHPEPYHVLFWGIGNESWGCGGPFTTQEYISELKRHATFTNNYNPNVQTQFVSVGPDSYDEFSFGYTEAIMDKYDPDTEVSILVSEWGSWLAPAEGTDPGFLIQQNSQRDAVNTFENPGNVAPKAIQVNTTGNNMSVTVQPQSVTVLTIDAR